MSKADNTLIVVVDGSHVNGKLKAWLRGQPNWLFASEIYSVNFSDLLAVKRNRICEYFLDRTDFEYLLMLDADMVPVDKTSEIFKTDADIASCPYLGSAGKPAHGGFEGGNTAAGCLRISRYALEAIDRPWFQMGISSDGLNWVVCECSYFTSKAKAAGFSPVKVGSIDHRITITASIYLEDGKPRSELKFGCSTGGTDG